MAYNQEQFKRTVKVEDFGILGSRDAEKGYMIPLLDVIKGKSRLFGRVAVYEADLGSLIKSEAHEIAQSYPDSRLFARDEFNCVDFFQDGEYVTLSTPFAQVWLTATEYHLKSAAPTRREGLLRRPVLHAFPSLSVSATLLYEGTPELIDVVRDGLLNYGYRSITE